MSKTSAAFGMSSRVDLQPGFVRLSSLRGLSGHRVNGGSPAMLRGASCMASADMLPPQQRPRHWVSFRACSVFLPTGGMPRLTLSQSARSS